MGSPKINISNSFESLYPNITQFVQSGGHLEMGYNDQVDAFALAYDEGGTIYQGKRSYPSLDAMFDDVEQGIQAYNDKWGIY